MRIVSYLQGNFASLWPSIKLEQLTDLIYTDVHPASSTDPTLLSGFGWSIISQVVTLGHSKGCKVLVSLWSGGLGVLKNIVNTPSLLSQLTTNIFNMVNTYNLDGIDINWEPWENQVPETDALINALYPTLHSQGKVIMVAGVATTPNVGLAASAKVDLINLMTYDLRYPDHSSYADTVAAVTLWVNAGYDRSKITIGIPFFGKDADSAVALYRDIVNELNPSPDQNEAHISSINSWLGPNTPVDGGVLWWNGIDLARQKVNFVLADGLGGIMCFEAGEDKLNDPRSLLQAIYEEATTMANVFPPGAAKVAKVTIDIDPSGLPLEMQVWLGTSPAGPKVAASSKIAFTSTGSNQVVNCPITMPSAGGDFNVYIDILYEGALVLGFIGTEPVIIISGTLGPITW